MCRSIQTLRPPYVDDVTDADVRAAALQYVRKVAGMRAPSAANREAFDRAVDEIAHATTHLLEGIVVRGGGGSSRGVSAPQAHGTAGTG